MRGRMDLGGGWIKVMKCEMLDLWKITSERQGGGRGLYIRSMAEWPRYIADGTAKARC